MNIGINEKKNEAVERMKKIGMFPDTIKEFEATGQVCESLPPLAACYHIDEDTQRRVREFEQKYNALVFHIMRSKYEELGELETYMYICDDRDEWELDREDLDYNQACCFVNNLTLPDFSEFGAVGFKLGPAHGLLRTW